MTIKSLLAQKRIKTILTCLYLLTALLLLLLTGMHKIAVGSFAGSVLFGLGFMLWLHIRGRQTPPA
jgi:ABC-type bacteriocin/lantibiotic exporter with double-glycine peptidase domain